MPLPTPSLAPPHPAGHAIALRSFTYDERRHILPAVAEAMSLSGCWLLQRRPVSLTELEFRFELQLGSILELYAALQAAGLELHRASHLELTALCTLLRHSVAPAEPSRLLTVQLEVSFLDELTLQSLLAPGAALA